jgi:PAS domain S-box-containing protein
VSTISSRCNKTAHFAFLSPIEFANIQFVNVTITPMSDTVALSFKHLSNLSEELHLILGKEREILFANHAICRRIENIHSSDDVFKRLGLQELYSVGAIEECLKTSAVLELLAELDVDGELTTIQWRIVPDQDMLTFIGKDLGNRRESEGDKFAQALHEIQINQADKNYSGRLTDIQRVLAEEVDKFKLISENVSDIVCLHEPHEARYLYVSPSCKEVTGYVPDEMEGRSPYDFFHPDMIKALEEDHRRREAGEIPVGAPSGPPPKMIYLFKTKDRGFRWMESHSRPIFDKKGNVILILSTSRDVHEREEAEKEKERFFNYYRTLGNNIPNGAVFMIDRDYNYLIAEGEEFEKLGRTSEYYVGKNAKDLYTPERFKRLSFFLEKLFAGESVSFDWEFNDQDYVFLGKPCIEKDGSIPSAILLTQNVTESRIQAARLKRTLHELEAKNFELDSFVYRTSHDLRSPLASILGLVEIMLKEVDINNVHDCTLKIRDSVRRLDTTISSILDYSRNGNLDVQITNVNIAQLWKQSIDVHKNMPQAEGIQFSYEGDIDDNIKLDAFRLSVIFNNLISNAIKYCDMRKEPRYVKLLVRRSVNGLQLIVKDNGLGILKEHQSRVFNMFYRASELSQGAGLGLYIVKQAVDKLGGVIFIDSEEKIGTSFTVTLPLTSEVQ